MFYIDDYNEGGITGAPPTNEDPGKLTQLTEEAKRFWYLAGITVAEDYKAVKDLLAKHNIQVTDPKDAINAMTDMWSTDFWQPFLKDLAPLMAETIGPKFPELLADESGFDLGQAINATAQIGSAVAGGVASSKDAKAAQASANAIALKAQYDLQIAREQNAATAANEKATTNRIIIISVILFILIALAIIAFVVWKKNQNAETENNK